MHKVVLTYHWGMQEPELARLRPFKCSIELPVPVGVNVGVPDKMDGDRFDRTTSPA